MDKVLFIRKIENHGFGFRKMTECHLSTHLSEWTKRPSPFMKIVEPDESDKAESDLTTSSSVESQGTSPKPKFKKEDKPRRPRGGQKKKKQEKLPKAWDRGKDGMSATPDLHSPLNFSALLPRVPTLVDERTGVITPSLLIRFKNVKPCGSKTSIFYDYWFNNEFMNGFDSLARTFNGSDSEITARFIRNYFEGVSQHVACYIHLSSVHALCSMRQNGDFDRDAKLKESVEELNRFYHPLRSAFREELVLYKQAIERYFLPPKILEILEQVYSPKFAKYAGMRTIELTSEVFPMAPYLMASIPPTERFDVELYRGMDKQLASLFIDEWFRDKVSDDDKQGSFIIPRKPCERILNFISHNRTILEAENRENSGEFRPFNLICRSVLKSFSLEGKLKDSYNVVSLTEGERFARINDSQTLIEAGRYVQIDYDRVYQSIREKRTVRETFGSIEYISRDFPLMEVSGEFYQRTTGRGARGSYNNYEFDPIEAYHSERGESSSLDASASLMSQLCYKIRESRLGANDVLPDPNISIITPGIVIGLTDRNGGCFVYTIENRYSNVVKNIFNYKDQTSRWFLSVEQNKYTTLRLHDSFGVAEPKMVDSTGKMLPTVTVTPEVANDSELVPCTFNMNLLRSSLGQKVTELWRDADFRKRLLDFPDGPHDRWIEDIRR